MSKPGAIEGFPDKYVVRVDAIDNFIFELNKDGQLSIDLHLIGHYNFGKGAHELFHIGVNNIEDDINKIEIEGDLVATQKAREQYAYTLQGIRGLRGKEFVKNDFEIEELGVNEIITRFESMKNMVVSAIGDRKLQATESTYLNGGFTGHINQVLQANLNVDKAINSIRNLSDKDLIEKIYRQKDQKFIHLLNAVRNRSVTEQDVKDLNKRLDPTFEPPADSFYINLTTTNDSASYINEKELLKLKGKLFSFHGKITGEFKDTNLPTAIDLKLKIEST